MRVRGGYTLYYTVKQTQSTHPVTCMTWTDIHQCKNLHHPSLASSTTGEKRHRKRSKHEGSTELTDRWTFYWLTRVCVSFFLRHWVTCRPFPCSSIFWTQQLAHRSIAWLNPSITIVLGCDLQTHGCWKWLHCWNRGVTVVPWHCLKATAVEILT